MPEAISIDALLKLKTEDAVKQLAALGKNQKPINIPVKFNAEKISATFAEITSSAISSKLRSSFESIGDGLVTKIEDAFAKSKVKTSGGGLLGGLTNIITAPLQGIARGAFEGVGREVSRKFGMGLSKGIDAQASQFIGSFDLLGEKIITKVIPDLTNNAIAKIKSTALGKQLAEAMKDLDINEARNNLKKRFQDLLGDSDLLIEQEFQRATTKKTRSRKKVIAQKEVASQLVTELQQQPKLELRNKAIVKQIEQLEKQNVKEQELIAKVTEKFKPDKKNVKLFNELSKKLESRTKEVSNLQFLIKKQEATLSRLQKVDQRAEQARALIGETRERFKEVTGVTGKEDEAKKLAQQIKRQKEILAQALKDRARRPQLEAEANKEIQELKQQITQIIKEGQSEKEALAKVQKKLEFDLKTINSIKLTRDKIAARKEQIAKLTQEQQKIFKPVAQQKLAKLGVDTSGVSRVQTKADETREKLQTQIENLEQKREERKEEIKIVEKSIAELQQSVERISLSLNQELKAQVSLQGTPLFNPSLANLLKKQITINEQKIEFSKKRLIALFKSIKSIDEQKPKIENIKQEIEDEKLLASLQQQIAVIQKVTQKSAMEIAKAIALGQGKALQKSIDIARKQADKRLTVINNSIEKGSSISETAIAKGETEVAKSAVGKLITKRKELEKATQKLLQEKSKLVSQQNKGQDVTTQLEEIEAKITNETRELTKVRQQLQKVESKSFGKTKTEVEKNYEDLQLSRYIETQKIVLNTSKQAASKLNKAQQLVEDIEEQAVKEIQNLQERSQKLITSLQPLIKSTKVVEAEKKTASTTKVKNVVSSVNQKVNRQINNVFFQQIVNSIARQVEQISGVTLQKIPQIIGDELKESSALYSSKTNQIIINKDILELDQVKFKQLSERYQKAIVRVLSHEVRHAIQHQQEIVFGSFDKLLSKQFFLTPTPKEASDLSKNIEGSVQNGIKQGVKETDIKRLRIFEEDAYTFAYRYSEEIAKNVFKILQIETRRIDKLIPQIKPATLPKPPAISSRAFPVIESSQDLQQLLEKQISALGLKEIVKRLGLGTDSPIKKVAIERVVNAYKQDALKVQELIARFGDDIKLKSAKTGSGSSFGSIDDESALTESFKQNQKILKEAYILLDELSEEQRKALAKKISAIALEQVETIDKISREFKVSGKTGQSLSGTRSQLANINDSLINITAGIATGVNQEIVDVKKQGYKTGEAFKQGFDNSTGIKSPAREFIKKMKFVGQGIQVGAKKLFPKVNKTGELLGASLLKGFRTKLKIKSPSDESKKDMINVIQGIIIAAEISFNRLRKLGVRLGDEILVGFTKSKIAQGKIADQASKQVEKEVAKVERQNQKATNTVINRIKNNLKTAKQILKESSKQLSQQEQQTEQENTNFIARVQSRIFRNQGIGNAPIQDVSNTQQRNVIDNIKTAIASIQNDLRNAGIQKASKQAEQVVLASKDLLDNLKVTVTVGQDAAVKIRQANRAIARLEEQQKKAIKGIGKLKGADKLKVKAEVRRIQSQIEEEQKRIAALRAQHTEAKKLLPVYKQLGELNQQLQRALANQDVRGIRRLNREINQIFTRINQPPPTPPGGGFLSRINQQLERIGITGRRVANTLKGLATLAVGSIFIGGFDDVIRQITEVTIKFEQLETAIKFTAGSSEAGAKRLKFIRDESNRLKIDIETATRSFKGLAAAARGTALEKETEKIFSSVAQASRVFGLTAEQTDGALLAISQIISKGTVQAEELRGQLGERLPGAFQIAARSMNVTTAELGKLLETGQVTSDEFLPKFIAQLEKETRPGLAQSLRTVSAAITGVQNEFKLLQLEIGKRSQGTSTAALNALAKALELVRENLHIILPVVKTTASLLAIALVPAAMMLGKFLLGAAKVGLNQLITLLGVTNSQLLATNAQLILLAKTSPKMALLIGTLGKLRVVLGLVSAALKGFVIVETISVLADTFGKTAKAGQEVRDSVDQINDAINRLNTTLASLEQGSFNPQRLAKDIAEENKKKLREDQNYFQKATDATKKFLKSNNAIAKIARRSNPLSFILSKTLTFEESQLSRIQAATGDAIAANQELLRQADSKLGIESVTDKSTEELKAYADAIETSTTELQKSVDSAVDPNQINALNTEISENQKRLEKYNAELARRKGLELNLAKIVLEKENAITAATRAETEALAAIDAEILKSGDFKKDVELQKLQYAKTRLAAELAAEEKAFVLTKQLAQEKGGIDPETGKPKDAQQLKEFEKTQKRINELQRASVENNIALIQKETEQKIAEYNRYLDEIEDRRQQAEDITIESEKQRLIEIQQLINDDVISTKQAEKLKANTTYDRIRDELEQEKRKFYELQDFKTDSVEAQEKADGDIKTSRQKILDLTLQLLQEEQQAEERTTNAIAESRDNLFSKMEGRLSRIQQLYSLQSQLESDRATSQDKLADLELSRLKQALAIRQQINSGDLDKYERETAIKQLYSLGVKGRTDEISLLNKIESKEEAIAKAKMANLERQHELAKANLEIENQRFELETRKAKFEADKEVRQSEQKVLDADTAITEAEQAIASATTEEELEIANQQLDSAYELYDIAQLGLKLANQEQIAANQQLDNLDSIIAKKRENLELSQAIAKAELEGISLDQLFERDKAFNQAFETEDRRKAKTLTGKKQDKLLNQYLTSQEKVEQETEKRVNRLIEQQKERLGDQFTSEDESALREQQTSKIKTSLTRQFNQKENREENKTIRSLFGSPGFSIEAPPEILNAIKNGKPFVVPVIPEVKSNVPKTIQTIGETKGSLDSSSLILNTLKNIEQNFKQPTVINVTNDNQFVNQYQRNDTDEILRRTRSDLVEVIRTVGNDLSY